MKKDLDNIRAVVFDLDNTLYDEKLYIEYALKNVAKTFCQHIYRNRSINELEVFNYIINDWVENGEKELFQRLLDRYKIEINKTNIQQLVLAYRSCKAQLVPFSEVNDLLPKLKNKGFKLGIITNGGKDTQRNKINLLGISKLFDAIIITGEWFPKKHWKPNKLPFNLCFEILQIKPNECMYVGDQFDNDIVGAYNAGALPILIDRNIEKGTYLYKNIKNIDYIVIQKLDQIVDLLCERSNIK